MWGIRALASMFLSHLSGGVVVIRRRGAQAGTLGLCSGPAVCSVGQIIRFCGLCQFPLLWDVGSKWYPPWSVVVKILYILGVQGVLICCYHYT